MTKTHAIKCAAFAALSVLTIAGGAAAAHPGKGRGADKAAESDNFSAEVGVSIHIGDAERRIVRDYYADAGNCPPGLAKKHNGCLPPGQAKKRYRIGRPLPDDAVVVELPYGILVRLPVLPRDRGYRLVDGDLAVVDLSTHVVIDARAIF